jgi:penicillin-binding protein 1A
MMAAERKRKKASGTRKKADRGTARSRDGRRSFPRRLLSWTLALALWGFFGGLGLIAYYAYDLPDVKQVGAVERAPTVTLVAADGGELVRFGGLYTRPVTLAELPPHLPHAVLATEDRRFYDHFGLDLIGLVRAVYVNLRAGTIRQGGSTITQQLAKNLFLTPERTLKRKVQETLLALWLERLFTKDQILTLYLNRVYLGAGTYGVEAAARKYFDRPAHEVNLAQAAMLAGLLKAPTRYAPTGDLARARERAAQVLDNMVAAGFLGANKAAAAKRRPAALAPRPPRPGGVRYFADWVLERVPDYVGHTTRDLVVVTTLDRDLQQAAQNAVERVLAGPGAKQGARQAALLALAPDGAVRALVGGRSYAQSQFNRATQARRQPGSAFKLFVYLAGLEAGMTPDDVLRDEPVQIGDWRPQNYGRGHAGDVTLRRALAKSINTVAVKVSERAGRDKVVAAARRLGVAIDRSRHPSIALGTAEVSLVELTTAYATLANGGAGIWSYAVDEVRDGDATVLYRRQGSGPGRVIAPRQIAQLNDMLGAAISEGTGKAARLDRPAGGKTGTSQQFRDAWFVGYTAQLAAGVWVGNDDASPMRKVTGGGLPARIWRDFMVAAHTGLPKLPLPGPKPGPEPGFLERLFAGVGSETPSWQRERDVK